MYCGCSAHAALVDAQHQRRLDDICERLHLLVAKHRLEHGEDTLCRSRIGREGEDNLCSLRPRWELGHLVPLLAHQHSTSFVNA